MVELSHIHRWEHAAPSAKTLLVLHGTGGDEQSLLSIARNLAPGWNLLSPRGQVSENGANRFFRRFAEGVFDIEDLRTRANELASFVSEASDAYGFDPAEVVAFGYSNGANIASATMLLHPGALAGAALVRAIVPLVPSPLPKLEGKRVAIANGKRDPLEPPGETERLAHMLRECGADVRVYMAEAGHELTRADIQSIAGWLRSPARHEPLPE